MDLSRYFDDAAQQAQGIFLATRAAPAAAQPSPFFASSGGDDSIQPFAAMGESTARYTNLSQATEQYRHFAGWPYAGIRAISQTIAHQPVRVAVHVNAEEQAPQIRSKRAKSWDRRLRDKRMLPTAHKDFAEDLDILESHPLLEAIRDPNPIMVQWGLLYVTVASLEITGKAYWWVTYSEEADRWFIWPIPSDWMTPNFEDGALYASWSMRTGRTSSPRTIPGNEVLFFHYPDPSNPFGAISPMQAQARAVLADESISESQRMAFTNGIFPGSIITIGRHPDVAGSPGERPYLTADQRLQAVTEIERAYRGVRYHNKPMIADALIQDIKPFTLAPREMDFTKSGQVTKDRILQGLGVSNSIIGQSEHVNRATAVAALSNYYNQVVNPKIELMSQIMTKALGPAFARNGEKLLVFIEEAQADDMDTQIQEETLLAGHAAISVNELRTAHGKPPISGGDVAWMPPGQVPVPVVREGAADASEVPTGVGDDAGPDQDNEPVEPQTQPQAETPVEPAAQGGAGQVVEPAKRFQVKAKILGRDGIKELWLKTHGKHENLMLTALRTFYKGQGEQFAKHARDIAISPNPKAALRKAFDPAAYVADLKATIEPILHRAAVTGAASEWELYRPAGAAKPKAFAKGTISIPTDIMDAIDEWIKESIEQPYWTDIGVAMQDDLIALLAGDIEAGKSTTDIADDLQGLFGPGMTDAQALNIARSETTGALNLGGQVARDKLQDMGMIKAKMWYAILDTRVRPDHEDAHEQQVPNDEPFVVGDYLVSTGHGRGNDKVPF